jgi:hypothetical protein
MQACIAHSGIGRTNYLPPFVILAAGVQVVVNFIGYLPEIKVTVQEGEAEKL